MKVTLLLVLFISLSCLSYGQTFRFNQYTTEDGISQNFIYSINQDKKGYLWVGTGEGLCRFDGKHFETYSTKDGLIEDVITCSFVDGDGTQWFGHNEGGITKFDGDIFKGIKREKLIESKINSISGFGKRVFGVAQNHGLFEIANDKLDLIGTFGVESFHAIQCVDEENILLGTSEGLLHLKFNGKIWDLQKKYLEDYWITDISKSHESGNFLLCMNEGGIKKLRIKNGEVEFSDWNNDINLDDFQIKQIMEDADLNIWLGTYGEGMIKLHADSVGSSDFEMTKYNTKTGMSSDFVQSVFQDREGNIWVGTFGAGLSTLIDDFFTFYSYGTKKIGNNVSSVWVSGDERWYGVENGLIRVSNDLDSGWTFYNGNNGLVDDKITSLYFNDSIVWIGTGDHGLYNYDLRAKKFNKIPWDYGSLQKKVNQITADKYSVWVATEGGLIVYYTAEKTTSLFDTEMGLAHNSIKTVCKDSEGNIWMGTHSRFLYAIQNNSINEFEMTNGGELEVVSIAEASNGDLWVATAENGVFRKIGDSFSHYSTSNGLKSNYTYAVYVDANDFVWVGHRGGLSRLDPDEEKVTIFDHKSGIDEQVNSRAMYLDEKDYLWIGTDGGAIKYDPSKDRKSEVTPMINLISIVIDDKEYAIDEDIDLPYGHYRVHFKFMGISFKNPEDVRYQFMLEGYDEVYSDFTQEPHATYGRLADGKYTFKVMAFTDELCSETAATINIRIRKPFWKQIWFYILVLFLIVGIVILIVRARVKRFQANQLYLEEQLEIKTKEVVEKADIIQEINKDMTASINYAERIQFAILPKIETLVEKFPDSFIFFRPRDIVSGDFYFMREYEKKIIIACVDCTGHGVPGAFMSMIGSTTLRNIYKIMERTGKWLKPDVVLDMLDEEIQKILHQRAVVDEEEDFFKSRDGMDMTLIEIDLETNTVELSSAKRHSIIVQNHEIEIISGDKRPIGGGEIDQVDFSLQTYHMNKGDRLFLFSDGYPDQFGGEDGRKMKLSGVKKVIEGMMDKKSSEYESIIANHFDAWQGDIDQIDDVLMIGLVFC